MLLAAIEKLSALERLERIADVALGFGSIKKETSRSIMRRLMKAAGLSPRERAEPASEAGLAGVGIKVVRSG